MKRFPSLALVAAFGLSMATPLMADHHGEKVEHFKGKASPTLEAAVKNFSETNKELEALLAKPELSPADLVKVHELTYTLENALKKIDDELDDLAETLEVVHKASEKVEADAVRKNGAAYLKTARQVIP